MAKLYNEKRAYFSSHLVTGYIKHKENFTIYSLDDFGKTKVVFSQSNRVNLSKKTSLNNLKVNKQTSLT